MAEKAPPKTRSRDASNTKSQRIIQPHFFVSPGRVGTSNASDTLSDSGRAIYRRKAEQQLDAISENWAHLAQRFKRYLETSNRSPGTIASYLQALQMIVTYFADMGMPDDPEAINGEYIEQYFIDLMRGGASPNTARIRFASLRVFFKWAERVGEIRPSPMASLTPPKPVDVVKPVYTLEDVQQMLDSCDDATFVGRRDKAAILVLFDCGLRASEFLSLTVDDVNLKEGVLIIRHPKGQKQRAVPMGSEAETAVSRYLRQRKRIDTVETALWTLPSGKPLGMGGLRSLALRHGAKGLHVFRHSSATAAASNRLGEIDMLRTYGWTSIAMAKRYTEARGAQLSADAKRRASPGRGLRV